MSPGRLKKNWEFKNVYRHGSALVTRNIVLYYFVKRTGELRVGFSISKKIGKSVERHRIKRIYKEAFLNIAGNLKNGIDFVLVARKPSVDVTFQQAREELIYLCRKGKLLK